jgi:Lon protease-like protein
MAFNKVDLALPNDFNKNVRLFPLPNLVLFPGVIQALHLFEPRYRQLIADALATDELITMSLLRPGWKSELANNPEIYPTVCVGKIVTHARLEDGRYNLLLMGAQRARIIQEIDYDVPYRMAEIEICDEITECSPAEATELRNKIIKQFRNLASRRPHLDEDSLEQLLGEDLSLGRLIDLVCYSSGADPVEQQQVLEASETCRRAEIVISLLQKQNELAQIQLKKSSIDFPPDFSLN